MKNCFLMVRLLGTKTEKFFQSLIKVEFRTKKMQKINISYFPVKQKPKFTSSKDLLFFKKKRVEQQDNIMKNNTKKKLRNKRIKYLITNIFHYQRKIFRIFYSKKYDVHIRYS